MAAGRHARTSTSCEARVSRRCRRLFAEDSSRATTFSPRIARNAQSAGVRKANVNIVAAVKTKASELLTSTQRRCGPKYQYSSSSDGGCGR
ncbi:hypothetical protein GA0115253_1079423 [Streptomyces sp. Termitarium-T10T-6]|nr:hypothetical protein GA0115253_1079423 [Streptomyces sp. Termitarium-T10T-6]